MRLYVLILYCAVIIDEFFTEHRRIKFSSENIGGIKLWQDVQHQFTVIARQVEGQTAQCAGVEVVIAATTLIPHILHRILHYQTVL